MTIQHLDIEPPMQAGGFSEQAVQGGMSLAPSANVTFLDLAHAANEAQPSSIMHIMLPTASAALMLLVLIAAVSESFRRCRRVDQGHVRPSNPAESRQKKAEHNASRPLRQWKTPPPPFRIDRGFFVEAGALLFTSWSW